MREACEVVDDKQFVEACRAAKVEPTIRQARKWLRGDGHAFKTAHRGLEPNSNPKALAGNHKR